MERLKCIITTNTETIQQEIHEITIRLNNIIQQNKKLSKDIKSLSYDDFMSNKEYWLNISSQQYNLLNNLHVANLQLEEYQLGNKSKIKSAPKSPSKSVTFTKKATKTRVNPINCEETTSDSSSNHKCNNDNEEKKNDGSSKDVIVKKDQPKQVKDVLDKFVINTLQKYGLFREQMKNNNNRLTASKLPDLKFKNTNSIKYVNNVDASNPEVVYFEGNLKPPLAPYKNMSCIISHIVSPSEFYINQLSENIEAIERISSDYSTHHDNSEFYFLRKSEAKTNLKKYCLCYIDSWQFWFRARVIDWLDVDVSEENVQVYLVDYGNTMNVTFKNLRPLLKKYSDLPECAIKCNLAHLYPLGSTSDIQLNDWPQEAITGFKNITGPENQFFFSVVYVDKLSNSWGIDLVKTSLTDVTSKEIGQQLLDNKLCVEIVNLNDPHLVQQGFINSQVETAQGFDGTSSKMTDNEKLETFCRNIDVRESENLDDTLSGYKAKDQVQTCQIFLRHGSCYKLPNCRFDHEPLRKDGYTTDETEGSIISIQLPEEGEPFKVRITSIFSLTRWYGNRSTEMSTFNQLSGLLNNPELVQNYKSCNITPSLGELVIVKYETSVESSLWKWCRGQIYNIYKDESSPEYIVEVFLVDIGEFITTFICNLRLITKELGSIPFQAVLLKLHGIKEKEEMCKKEVIEYCQKNFVGKNVSVTVLQRSSAGLLVTMKLNSRKQHKLDVSELIIKDGYGVISDDDIQVKRDHSLKHELSQD